MINFYIKLKTMNSNNKPTETKEFSFDFKGIINSYCKKRYFNYFYS